ncbi:RDD family protein [Streptomyces sp. BI20]|uniref:RDD family protein n=1 Tax=Streptomyces sp. BI20 TaxID=3403460 RepID=UPI003C75BC4D
MSTDQPPPGPPPEDDPFLKKPHEQPPPAGGSPYGAGSPPPPPPGSGYPPPPPPYSGDPYGGDPYGGAPGGAGGAGGGFGMPDPLAGMPPLASFGKRLGARVIDLLIVSVPFYLLQWLFDRKRYTVQTNNGEDVTEVITRGYNGSGLLWTLIGVVAYVAYDWFFTKKDGRTPGKRAMGLRVAMLSDGSVPASGAALGRAAMLWVPTQLCCSCLWPLALIISILVDKPYSQGLHDKVAKTVVVTAP